MEMEVGELGTSAPMLEVVSVAVPSEATSLPHSWSKDSFVGVLLNIVRTTVTCGCGSIIGGGGGGRP